MPFAIVLLFDEKSDKAVRRLGRLLEKKQVPSIFLELGADPHLSLADFEDFDFERLFPRLKKIVSDFYPMPFSLSSLANFPGKAGVLFLAPIVTVELLQFHSRLHKSIRSVVQEMNPFYVPGHWVPHCTVAMNLSPKKIVKGFRIIREINFPISGRYNRLALVKTYPRHIRPIQLVCSIPFSSKKC
ncbi:MAG TPA: 2'-5' RNA ligase family protein [bacterium]